MAGGQCGEWMAVHLVQGINNKGYERIESFNFQNKWDNGIVVWYSYNFKISRWFKEKELDFYSFKPQSVKGLLLMTMLYVEIASNCSFWVLGQIEKMLFYIIIFFAIFPLWKIGRNFKTLFTQKKGESRRNKQRKKFKKIIKKEFSRRNNAFFLILLISYSTVWKKPNNYILT